MAITIDEFQVKINNLGNVAIDDALTKACLLVERTAKTKCPVDTGNLRSSITYNVNDDKGEVGTNVEYAPWVEFGTGLYAVNGDGRKDVPWKYQSTDGSWHTTSGMNPQPFLGPALEENKKEIMNLFKDSIEENM